MNFSDKDYNRLIRILTAVTKRVQERVDSIDPIFKFERTGIEAWFKVELIVALERLGEEVVSLKNKGPDVILSGGLQIELKAATDFNPSYLRDGALKDDVPCIFLGSGERKTNIDRLKSMNQIQFVGLNFLKGIHTWAIGCIIPSTYTKETKNQEEEKPLQGHFRQKQNSRRHRNRKINQELETITNSEKLPHKNRGRQSLLYELEEPKYTLEQVFKNQKASDNVEKIIKHFHNEISFQLKSNRLQWKAKTNIRGISYFCNKRNAFLYADIYQQNVTLKFFTGNKTINGLIKANWRTGGDTLGSAPLKIFDIDSISQAVMFAVEAYKIANNWND